MLKIKIGTHILLLLNQKSLLRIKFNQRGLLIGGRVEDFTLKNVILWRLIYSFYWPGTVF